VATRLLFAAKETKSVTQEINVLALVKGSERYIFLFDDKRRSETLRVLGRYASNPDLSFTWYDAAVLSQKIRRSAREQEQEQEAENATKAQRKISPRFRLPHTDSQTEELT
jgi:hypothetical protein